MLLYIDVVTQDEMLSDAYDLYVRQELEKPQERGSPLHVADAVSGRRSMTLRTRWTAP
jgi:hypothetical protein